MPEARHQACYGQLFPSILALENDQPLRGKVFAFQLFTGGGTFRAGRNVSHDISAWDECVACAEYEHCYKLSLGRLMLENAIGDK